MLDWIEQRALPFIDHLRPLLGALLLIVPVYLVGLLYYFGAPSTLAVGYQPVQPLPFSHQQHAGDLGIDCRYCHNTVEDAALAAVPPTATCQNCHMRVATQSDQLLLVRQSESTGDSIPWVRVHDLPNYVYFDHSAHVTRGVGCVSCHGRIDTMKEVRQVNTLSMGWCLDCHRNPEPHLRPLDKITTMDWVPNEAPEILGRRLAEQNNIDPSTDCSTCHR